MSLTKSYSPAEREPELDQLWQSEGVYRFDMDSIAPVYSIDTPPPTVSGNLHLGHAYSYSHADFMARFFRMNGYNVFYPMGFDDNGLPTERLVEKRLKITAAKVGRQKFIEACLAVSQEAEVEYHALWRRLGLSVDWRYTYRTINDLSRKTAQLSFIRSYRQGLAQRKSAPAIWCPECQTAIAQAELNDLERPSEFVTLPFKLPDGHDLPIATTRPELLAACVAVFVHPEDARYRAFIGRSAAVPLYGQGVPILPDPAADPQKGTGAVMCCTFGDQTDVAWWYTHHLPLIEAVDRQGRMMAVAGDLAGLPLAEARQKVKQMLEERGMLLDRQPTLQSIRVHERCDTPVEYIVASQWFITVLDHRPEFLAAGEQVHWHPATMHARYQDWVENLNWDWCVSRQRYFGVPFPVWYCAACGEMALASEADLPVDPLTAQPSAPCPKCGGNSFNPDHDVMDTWATSSLSPQIVGGWLSDPQLYAKVFPFSLRPQAHEIIRTWAFYTIVKSHYHFNQVPWQNVLISGWGLAGEGMGKISKSRGGGPMPPLEMIQRYSADAVRYWAASTGTGKDSIISEEKIQMGGKLVTKLWNVGRFTETFLSGGAPLEDPASFTPADRWILARLQNLIRRATAAMQDYEYASAKNEVEAFFWKDLADNYLEMAKQRLYSPAAPGHGGATFALRRVLLATLKLLAPFLPYVTDALYRELFATAEGPVSIHSSAWPQPEARFEDAQAEATGETLVEIATAVRRFKSEHSLSLGSELNRVQLAPTSHALTDCLVGATTDLMSVTRARQVEIAAQLDPSLIELPGSETCAVKIGIEEIKDSGALHAGN
jgi:valyl-tRNA synthetase